MRTIKESISTVLVNTTEKMAMNIPCIFLWGETEMPKVLRDKIESEDEKCN